MNNAKHREVMKLMVSLGALTITLFTTSFVGKIAITEGYNDGTVKSAMIYAIISCGVLFTLAMLWTFGKINNKFRD
jgi:hypothetical protein